MRDQPLTLKWSTGASGNASILEMIGPLTLGNLFAFQDELAGVKAEVLILDLSQSPYMDSAGLGSLLNYYVSAEKRGGKLLLCGVNERVRALLEMTKVHELLKSFPTIEAAEASLG